MSIYSNQVFVTNVPSLQELTHHAFLKLMETAGKITKYSIRRNLRTAIIHYEEEKSADQAVKELNESFVDRRGICMYVTKRVHNEYQRLFEYARKQQWYQVFELVTNTKLFHPNMLASDLKLMLLFSSKYELIACQHYELFSFINQLIDNKFFRSLLESHPHSLDGETLDEFNCLLVRREGWFLRKEKIKQWLIEATKFPDDIIKHILIEYMY